MLDYYFDLNRRHYVARAQRTINRSDLFSIFPSSDMGKDLEELPNHIRGSYARARGHLGD
jgi:hypothetical protein